MHQTNTHLLDLGALLHLVRVGLAAAALGGLELLLVLLKLLVHLPPPLLVHLLKLQQGRRANEEEAR